MYVTGDRKTMSGFLGRNSANFSTVTFDEILGGLANPVD
jgi:hypothetical protein